MTPTLILCAYLLLLGVATATARAADPPKGTVIAETIVQTWACQTQLGVDRTPARPSPWALKGHNARAVLNTWTSRRKRCLAALHERARQWNWQAWLPDKWQRIGACETGYGKRPGNWRHNSGTYQGAFGFYHGSWDAFKPAGYPDEAYNATPWEQYMVALAIYRRYGLSGWGCRNA